MSELNSMKKYFCLQIFLLSRYLEEGTAVNVTLMGNYTEAEVPYIATVVAIYKDGEKREILIRDTKRENKMSSIVAVYSPVYFLHNNSFVPTTTTTSTTTSTTTTTVKTTISTDKISPPDTPPEVVMNNKRSDLESEKKHDNGSMLSDEQKSDNDVSSLKKKIAESKEGPTGEATSINILSLGIILTVTFAIPIIT